jgi:AcrR family transcriptional regulator
VSGLSRPLQKPARERRDAAEHRQRVLEAARRLFDERGVEDVTMEDVALAAGVGKGTLYRRYADKGQLVLALMSTCVGELDTELRRLVEPTPDEADSVLAHLEAVLLRLVEWIDQHVAELRVIAQCSDTNGEVASLHANPLYTWLHGVIIQLIEQAVARGESDVVDPVYAADALLAALRVDLYQFQRQQRGYDQAHFRAGIHQLVNGLRAH